MILTYNQLINKKKESFCKNQEDRQYLYQKNFKKMTEDNYQ